MVFCICHVLKSDNVFLQGFIIPWVGNNAKVVLQDNVSALSSTTEDDGSPMRQQVKDFGRDSAFNGDDQGNDRSMECPQNLIYLFLLFVPVTDHATIVLCHILLDGLGLIASSIDVQFSSELLEVYMPDDA